MRMLRINSTTAARVSAPLLIRFGSILALIRFCLAVALVILVAIAYRVPLWNHLVAGVNVTLLPCTCVTVSTSEWPGR